MKILALEKPCGENHASASQDILKAEAQRVWELTQSGVLREIYFRGDRCEAILVLECDSVETAKTILSTLPLVSQGMIGFDVIPLVPYPGYTRLFSPD